MTSNVRTRVIAVLAALLTLGVDAQAQAIFGATSAVVNSGGTEGAGSINDTYNGNGLLSPYTSNVTNFDAYIAGNPLHTFFYVGNEWFSGVSSTATVTYDFGAVRGLDRFALWNEEFSGIGQLNILGSTDGVAFSSILSGLTPPNSPENQNYGATVYSFGPLSARYFRMEMSECPQPNGGGYNGCSIGEVAFRSASVNVVPEPATTMLMGAGLLALGAVVARRRRA